MRVPFLWLILCVPLAISAAGLVDAAEVLLVVDDPEDLRGGDARLRDHLRTGLGHDVTPTSPGEVPDLTDVDLVLISESVHSQEVDVGWRDVPVPMIVLENAIFEAMGFGSGDGTAASRDRLRIGAAASKEFADVPPGVHEVLSEPNDMKYVVDLAAGGEVLARTSGESQEPVLFRFDEGAAIRDGPAPARRVGLGLVEASYDSFVGPAWDLFDGAVAWSLGESGAVRDRSAMLLVGRSEAVNASEWAVRSRLRASGFDVRVVGDDALDGAEGYDLVVMSKTVTSTVVGGALRDSVSPILFWEDNQQRTSMLATIRDDGDEGTAWHVEDRWVHVAPGAEDVLPAGLDGAVPFYVEPDEITFAPAGWLTADAIPLATVGEAAGGHHALYVYERGAELGDGSVAAGRRGFFGLYDSTYRSLTSEGVAMFDAMVAWLVRPTGSLGAAPIGRPLGAVA